MELYVPVEGTKRGRRRNNKTLVVVKQGHYIKEMIKSMILDRVEWWRRIHVANPD
jgi:hypothetical protein